MQNGNGLVGGLYCQQPVFCVQKIGNQNQYYLFTVGAPNSSNLPFTIVGLHYSVIDMTLHGGLGAVVAGMKNIVIPEGDSAVDQITGTRHKNNRDAWVVVRKHGQSTRYLAYLVTSSGISSTPVVSASNLPSRIYWKNGYLMFRRGGDLKISQDGTKLVCSDSLTEICDFNSLTGVVTPKFTICVSDTTSGAEFSVDSRYLYLCRKGGVGDPNQYLGWQFDLSYQDSLSFMQHQVLIGDGFGSKLQLGPNWKIYAGVSNPQKDSLHCINNPSSPGLACNFQKNAVGLAGNRDNCGISQFIQRYKAYIHHSGQCQWNPIYFTSDIWPPPDTIRWDFGDPGSGLANFSELTNPTHIYSLPGTYTVELYVRHIDNRRDTSWVTFNILENPHPVLGPDRTICAGNSAIFDAGSWPGCSFEWKDVSSGLVVGTNQTLTTGIAGEYSVNVTNGNGCTGKDTVKLFTTPVPQVTNTQLTKSICSDESTNISLTSDVPGATFLWTCTLTSGTVSGFSADSGLMINQTLVNLGSTPGIVIYHITPRVGSCSGNLVNFQVTVNPPLPVTISIAPSANPVCAGSPVTFTATPGNEGLTPVYQWLLNGNNFGTGLSTYTYVPSSGDLVSCILTSSNTTCVSNNPATSNTVTMGVDPNMTVGVTIAAVPNPYCTGDQVTITATPDHGGLTPTWLWKINDIAITATGPVYTYTPVNGDQVRCYLTSSLQCTTNNPAMSNNIVLTENSNFPAGVNVTTTANPFCPGTSVTYTAWPTNGGTLPSYQWKVNGVNAGSNLPAYTYSPQPGDSIRCIMTSNLSCVTGSPVSSAKVIMSALPVPAVTFTTCFDTITTLNAKPIKLKGGIPYGGTYSGPGVNSSTGVFTPSVAGTGTKTITYAYTNVALCSAGKNKTITVQANPVFTCGNNLIDIRDNKVYPTVQIGTQCWMQANLDFGTEISDATHQTDNCINEKYVSHASPVTRHSFYQWDEVMRYEPTPGIQGLCPPGWHVPDETEWNTLFNFYQGNARAGYPLQDPYLNGFKAQQNGVYYLNSQWSFTDFATLFWSSTMADQTRAYAHGMNTIDPSVSVYAGVKANGFSVRCLKD